jgi:hypothetical protein
VLATGCLVGPWQVTGRAETQRLHHQRRKHRTHQDCAGDTVAPLYLHLLSSSFCPCDSLQFFQTKQSAVVACVLYCLPAAGRS